MPDLDLEALEKMLAESFSWIEYAQDITVSKEMFFALRNAAPALIAAARERDALRDELQRVRDIGLANLEREKRHVPADAVLEGLANDLQDANKDRYALREHVKMLADALEDVLAVYVESFDTHRVSVCARDAILAVADCWRRGATPEEFGKAAGAARAAEWAAGAAARAARAERDKWTIAAADKLIALMRAA